MNVFLKCKVKKISEHHGWNRTSDDTILRSKALQIECFGEKEYSLNMQRRSAQVSFYNLLPEMKFVTAYLNTGVPVLAILGVNEAWMELINI